MLADTEISEDVAYDPGIAAQSIMLGAQEKGLAGCIIGSIDRKRIRGIFNIPERYNVLLILALGKPKEKVVIEEIHANGDIRYWRDENNVHHVPKRRLEDIIVSTN